MYRASIILKNSFLLIPVLLGSAISLAQVSNTLPWTWMKGDNSSNSYSVYGTMGVPAVTNKPGGRETGGVEWTDTLGNLWLFAGYGYGESGSAGMLNDLWKYDPVINNWTWMNGDKTISNTGIYGTKGVASSSNKPGARYLAASWVDDSGNLWLFGGNGYASTTTFGSLNDLWKYNIATNMWTWMSGDNTVNNTGVYGTRGLSSATNKPGARNRFNEMIGRIDAAGYLWMFGGAGFASTTTYGAMNDLWKYNTVSNEWTWVSGDNTVSNSGVYGTMGTPAPANKPGARDGGACWLDTAGKFWLYGGGYDASGGWTNKLSDLWKYDPVTDQWTWMKGDNVFDQYGVYNTMGVTSASSNPGGRLMVTCWPDNYGNFWLFGGYGWAASGTGSNGNQGLNDLWKYDPLTNNWTWMKGDNSPGVVSVYGTQGVPAATNKPGNRSGTDQWVDANGNLWEFGGLEWIPTVFKNDLWKLVIPQPVAKGNLVSCQSLPAVTIDATNNNTWVPIFDSIGNIAAEINANSNNLGVVSTSLYTKTGACREDAANRLYLNRNITITPQTQPVSGNVSVRLYILKSELDSLKTALNSMGQPSGVASINEVDVFKNNDACLTVGSITALPLTATTGSYNADFYLQVNISSFSSFYFANKALPVILPVELRSFSGKRSGSANELKWEVSCYDKIVFNIERSSDGIHFNKIADLAADQADCNKPFYFKDANPLPAGNYYRLKIVELNGKITNSSIIIIPSDKAGPVYISLQNNLVWGYAMDVEIISNANTQVDLLIADVAGRVMLRSQFNAMEGSNHQFMNTGGLASGIYWIYAMSKWGRTNVISFVKR